MGAVGVGVAQNGGGEGEGRASLRLHLKLFDAHGIQAGGTIGAVSVTALGQATQSFSIPASFLVCRWRQTGR